MVLSNYWKWLNACNTINQSDQAAVDVGMKSTSGDAATIMFDGSAVKNYLIADSLAPAIGAGSNTYVKGDRVIRRDQKMRTVLVRNVSKPIDYNFSIRKLECPNCQASFDATKNTVCPFCGSTYRVEESDWAVESIKLNWVT